ncbi:MAG: hypothetical protein HYU77_03075 [Betaproteobacteria bacterium]|nr:hypothetical protein [Betaproteobacteria bacterium]
MKLALSLAGAALLATGCATVSTPPAAIPIAPAPISFDGHVAGQATDLVFMLEKNADPGVPGFALAKDDRLMVVLPKDFKRNDGSQIREDSDFNLVLTRGWPQAAVRQKDQYRIVYDAKANAIGVHARVDVRPEGPNAPGIKVIHLRGNTFLNPLPGEYPVEIRHEGADGKLKQSWSGKANILFEPPAARLAPTNFHLPPGTNSDFQTTAVATDAPHLLALLLWGEAGSPLNKVGIAPRNLQRFPKYTGGLLVQDTNGDKVLDPNTDKVVGGIIDSAPEGAKGQSATAPLGRDGKPILSGEVLRDAKYPGGGGKPNPGLLLIRFRAGDKPGLYRPTVELIGGNSYQFTIEAR